MFASSGEDFQAIFKGIGSQHYGLNAIWAGNCAHCHAEKGDFMLEESDTSWLFPADPHCRGIDDAGGKTCYPSLYDHHICRFCLYHQEEPRTHVKIERYDTLEGGNWIFNWNGFFQIAFVQNIMREFFWFFFETPFFFSNLAFSCSNLQKIQHIITNIFMYKNVKNIKNWPQ